MSQRINHAILSRRWAVLAGQVLVGMAFVGIWQIVAHGGLITLFLTSPKETATQAIHLLKHRSVLVAIGGSLESWGLGFVIAVIFGTVLGLLSQLVTFFHHFLSPILGLGNAIPYLLITSVFAFAMGFGNAPVVCLIALSLVFLVAATVEGAVRDVQDQYVNWSRGLGATGPQMLRNVYLPAVAVWVVSVSRNCLSYAISLSIIFSFVSGRQAGLGLIASSLGGIVVVCGLALCIDLPLLVLERRVGRYLPET